ncbi:MAG: pilus assembly protein TadG-related protein [Actinomycetes bacterium]
MNRGAEEGSVTGMLVVVMVVVLAFAGLALDGTRLLLARRDLQALADSAALAGASSIDERRFRESGGSVVVLDPAGARFAAAAVVSTSGWPADGRGSVEVSGTRVRVHLERPIGLTLLSLIGIAPPVIGATASADPRVG